MIEKIRISLWDIFTFFMTGVFTCIIVFLLLAVKDKLPGQGGYFEFLIKIPATYIIVVMPIVLILLGMLIEPLANFSDRYAGNYIFFWIKKNDSKRKPDESAMEEYISGNCFGDLNMRIKNPFIICKEYVETKQLSTTFMVFLARFGFYRNCSFIIILAGAIYYATTLSWAAFFWLLLSYFAGALLKKRADEFYSYQATAVYSAFLIDNLNWPSNRSSGIELPSKDQKNTKE